jgi:hypothetical protein
MQLQAKPRGFRGESFERYDVDADSSLKITYADPRGCN